MSRGIRISGINFDVPETIITNDDLTKIVDTSDEWIAQRTGIKKRRVVSGDENSCTLGAKAAQKILDKTGVNPLDIEMIIVASSSPHRAYPSVACELQAFLGCKNAAAFDIKAACSGFIYGLGIAKGFIKSGMYKKILIVATDATTKFVDWTDRATCVLFGDGAGAALVEADESGEDDIPFINLVADGDNKEFIYLNIPNANCPLAQKEDEKNHNIVMQGRDVYKYVMQKIPAEVNKILKEANLTADDIDYFIPHQANLRMIEALGPRLNFGEEKIITNIQDYGNISAASIPSVLTEGIKDGRIKLPSTVLICAFGAGMTIGTAIIKLRADLK